MLQRRIQPAMGQYATPASCHLQKPHTSGVVAPTTYSHNKPAFCILDRHNLNDMCEILQLPPAKVQKVLAAYPPALDMSPATVASKVATLTATLNVPASQAVKVACTCPRMLGLSSEMLICKVC